MKNAGLDEAQAGIKIARRNRNNLRYTDDTTLMAESEEEVDVFLVFSCFFYDQVDFANLISDSSASSKSIFYIWKFSVHVLRSLA